jgi:hypothetical protein
MDIFEFSDNSGDVWIRRISVFEDRKFLSDIWHIEIVNPFILTPNG